MIKIGVIGYGYWGPNLVRNFLSIPSCEITKIAEIKSENLKELRKHYPTIKTVTNADEVIEDKKIDAVIVATPISTHFKLGKKVLEANKHLLLEKPMTSSLSEALSLINLAKKRKKKFFFYYKFFLTHAAPNHYSPPL